MMGDAISHAVLPGIAIAFLLSGSRSVLPMFIGASAFGLLSAVLIEILNRRWRVQEDAAIGIVFTALFAIGVVLVSLFSGQVDLDQECVLYGEIAYTPFDLLFWGNTSLGPRPVWLLGAIFLFDLLLVVLLYKELLISSFDPGMAISVGINATLFHYLLMAAVSMTTVAAFESVGAILVVAMLIVPGATAYLLTNNLKKMLALAVLVGVLSAIGGYIIAGFWDSSIAGAMTAVAGVEFMLAFLFSPRMGVVSKSLHQFRLSLQVALDHILLALYRQFESSGQGVLPRPKLLAVAGVGTISANWALYQARRNGLIKISADYILLAQPGQEKAAELLRGHRLWESFVVQTGLPADHSHASAHKMEHFISNDLQNELAESLGDHKQDPHGKLIPASKARIE